MNKQIFNPYMPSWEYVPDGEPHVFGDRVYVYGSHDLFNGWGFCLGDYVCYSAPVDNLKDWRYEGVIYTKQDDPINKDGQMVMYAPDVTQGPDGRYYLYYVFDAADIVSVAVCNSPAGKYEFYGHVHHPDGTLYGQNTELGDYPQFDPGVFTEGDKTYLYTGFGRFSPGAMVTVLDKDMLTITQKMNITLPSACYQGVNAAIGTEYEGHGFFEASSMRKINGKYYFIYSSELSHELCYAVSDKPTEGFRYGGILISNCDYNIDTYKPVNKRMNPGGNNHGSIEYINGEYYIFYHRQTNGTCYSRQACAEKITLNPDGSFTQAEISSCGLNGGPLIGKGYYPAYIACCAFSPNGYPKITQDGKDGDEIPGHIANIVTGSTIGFKSFEFDGSVKEIELTIRAGSGAIGVFEIRTEMDGEVLASVRTKRANFWHKISAPITLPTGVHPLFLTYKRDPDVKGMPEISLLGFELK